MPFTSVVKVRFGHCDPAGIVFYPRYFEMLNMTVEDWFAAIGADFHNLHIERQIGTPTVRIDATFQAPSQLGDNLNITLTPTKVGTSSCDVDFLIACDGERRMTGTLTLVCMNLTSHRSTPWPDDVRVGLDETIAA